MSLHEEIEQAVESVANPEAIKNTLIEQKSKDRIYVRSGLMSWAMNRLETLRRNVSTIVPDHKTYDADGNVTETYSELRYKDLTRIRAEITELDAALGAYDWDAIQKLRDELNASGWKISGCWSGLYGSGVWGDYYGSIPFYNSSFVKLSI